MKLKLVRCTTCGSQMEIDVTEKQHQCRACGNTFVTEIGEELNNKENFSRVELQNLRINLNNNIVSNDIESILKFSQKILVLIPKDFTAKYYSVYSKSKITNSNELVKFLNINNINATNEEIFSIVNHMSRNIDLRYKTNIRRFILYNARSLVDLSDKIINERIKKKMIMVSIEEMSLFAIDQLT